ncbi:MAG: MBL fold metallo-hydrolase [Planctomycetota bacterium]|jgi:L-ascorbate metabolism protein UlaG (beta-lactamase superfamily)
MLIGEALVGDVKACALGPNECAFWWLGQQSFVLKVGETVALLDPYLSESPKRNQAPLLKPEECGFADLIFGSHDHTDHIDRAVWPAMAEAAPNTQFVVPQYHLPELSESLGIPLDRFVGMDDGRVESLCGLTITALASAHEFLDRHPDTGLHPFLGFVIEANGVRVYHPGDTCLYEGLTPKLQGMAPDLMFLPINGRDAERLAGGCIGNMTYQEAVDLAGAVGPALTVPTHWDMFTGNPGDPEAMKAYMEVKYPHLEALIPEYGARVVVKAKVRS